MVVRGVRRHGIGLAIHAALAIWAKTPLIVARVVLVVVWVAVVGVVIAWVLLPVSLGLRAWASLLRLTLRLLLRLLAGRVGGAVATVVALGRTSAESRLVVGSAALRILAQVILLLLHGIVATEPALLRRGAILLSMGRVLPILLVVQIVRRAVLLASGVV
jgi:hypothetical protein